MATPHPSFPNPRRDFFAKASAVIIGAATLVVPAVSGLLVFLNPLRRRAQAGDAVRVASLKMLPESGEPRRFPVLATRVDAWNRTPNVPVGAVYLQRLGTGEVRALNVTCPHAGCFVDFRADRKQYLCPCHNSTFALDGKVLDPKSPSPRALDELAVEIRHGDEIWVEFRNFRPGVKERILT